MSYLDINTGAVVARASDDVRARFIRRTYMHLAGAIALFALLEMIFFKIGLNTYALQLLTVSKWAPLGVFVIYGFASTYMHNLAHTSISREVQYLALFGGVLLMSLIFLPILTVATVYAPGVLENAIVVTLAMVAGITVVAFTTKKDFSFLAPALKMGFLVAIGLIVASLIFGFSLGIWFSGAMIIFASGAVIYETSNIIHHYSEDQYVGASLSLFSSIGVLFMYVIRFLLAFANNR